MNIIVQGIIIVSVVYGIKIKVEWENLIVDEVIKQMQKYGKWVNGVCDNCKYDWGKDAPIASVPNYCPNCGAKMESEDKE